MHKHITSWYSPRLQKEMPVAVYGHYGFALLMIPTAAADFLEYERFGLIHALQPFIDAGKLKVFSINSVNNESWMNFDAHPLHKTYLHNQWCQYVFEEVVPFIKSGISNETPVYTCGASFGALHSANLFFRRPDLFGGMIGMSGVYDLTEYSRGYFDDDVYFNSPMHYMPNLTDENILGYIRNSRHIHLFSGSGEYEDPGSAERFSGILHRKGIRHELDIRGSEWRHDWHTWRMMLPDYCATKF